MNAYFRCIDGCEGKFSLTDIIYKCPKCGSLLEVHHDADYLKKKSASEWKETFSSRMGTTKWPFGSGVWRYKEWINPDIDDENIVSMYEGNSNLFWAKRFGGFLGMNDLWVKMCGNTHTGSFKDLGMTVLVSQVNDMIARGKKIKAVACASTGDTSAALSAYCAYAGIPSIVFLPADKITTAQLVQPISNNSIVLSIDTDFDGCMKIVQEVTKNNEIYLANSMNSLRIEGQKTIAPEIVQQFGWEVPDNIIIPGGNLGNVSALAKGFSLMLDLGIITKKPRIILAQARNANPLYRSYLKNYESFEPVKAEKTLASAIQIGDPVSVKKAIKGLKDFNGIVEDASEDELADAAAVADKTGMYTCPHTAVALAALIKLVDKGEIKKDSRTVVVSTAHGLKFSEFKVGYHESSLKGIESKHANKPLRLAADVAKVTEALEKEFAARTSK
ncbi:MAG TPA: threonine synthase [Spirochaetota bacterium]|jgi:threonine synthase|nr:threonine synthase [Spirochaetota bacterium]HOR44928.1 threonine synthase [Spirochaetota bacterium]HOU83972.1 threonine synthase [Spirochaetota bacterium]HPK56483.1 threonine synthase [Spirochaetota bacterium]HQE58821.1 threonine synthase [Spirochaetota bacterium]